MTISTKISGLDNLDKVLANMTRSTRRKVHNKALRAGAKVVKDAAHENILKQFKEFTGLLSKKSTVAVYNARKYKGSFRVLVQIRRGLVNSKVMVKDSKTGEKGPVRVGLYASVGEYGSAKLNRRPRPWIRPAIKENESRAISSLTKEFNARLVEAVEDAKK